jgi:hypothetical protein
MVDLSFERAHKVLRFTFSGPFSTEDLDAVDPVLVRFLGAEEGRRDIRGLFDMTGVEVIAVPQTRFVERAGKPAIGDLMRVVVPPLWAGEDFGQSYRRSHGSWSHAQPIIVGTLVEAYTLLGMADPRFETLA